MTAPVHRQATSETLATTATLDLELNGVLAGDSVIVIILQTINNSRTYSVADADDGALTFIVASNADAEEKTLCFFLSGLTAGDKTITVTQSGGSFTEFYAMAINIGPAEYDTSSSDVEATNVTSHECASGSGITTAANTYLISSGVNNAAGGTVTPNGSATGLVATGGTGTAPSTGRLIQYRRSDAALTNELSTWTTSTARHHRCLSASFITPAATDVDPPAFDSASINTAGTEITVNLTDASVPLLPSTGATGFTLVATGGAVTISNLDRSDDDTYVGDLSRVVDAGEVLTLSATSSNLTDAESNALADFSSQAVTNNSTQNAGSISITSPALGDGRLVGVAADITATTANITNVLIELSTNNGSSYSTLAASTTLPYEWTPNSGQLTSQAIIRITSIEKPGVSDTSDVFAIATTSPGGGVSVIGPGLVY